MGETRQITNLSQFLVDWHQLVEKMNAMDIRVKLPDTPFWSFWDQTINAYYRGIHLTIEAENIGDYRVFSKGVPIYQDWGTTEEIIRGFTDNPIIPAKSWDPKKDPDAKQFEADFHELMEKTPRAYKGHIEMTPTKEIRWDDYNPSN